MDFALLRRSRDGALDNTFGTNGKVLTAIGAGTAATRPMRRRAARRQIVVIGRADWPPPATTSPSALQRRGTLDDSFGSGGKVVTSFGPGSDAAHAVVLQDDGKIVVGGETS